MIPGAIRKTDIREQPRNKLEEIFVERRSAFATLLALIVPLELRSAFNPPHLDRSEGP